MYCMSAKSDPEPFFFKRMVIQNIMEKSSIILGYIYFLRENVRGVFPLGGRKEEWSSCGNV